MTEKEAIKLIKQTPLMRWESQKLDEQHTELGEALYLAIEALEKIAEMKEDNMKELIEALHVIQNECKKYEQCMTCPLSSEDEHGNTRCLFEYNLPCGIDIDALQRELV